MNGAAYAHNGALWSRLAMEAVEQEQFDSVPNPEGVTSNHRFPFGLGIKATISSCWRIRLSGYG
jgi:hypothetical protein